MLAGLRSLFNKIMGLFNKECAVCREKDAYISFIKEQLDRERRDREAERAEYKRAMDRLLSEKDIRPIGQGKDSTSTFDPMQMVKIFDEVREEKEI